MATTDGDHNGTKTLLLCLPHAGGGPGVFRSWPTLGVRAVEVEPIVLPGRDRRIFDEPYADIHEAVAGIAGELPPLLDGRRVALFGHCLGALLCFELTRRLRADGAEVTHLIVSGSRAPHSPRERRASDITDDGLFLDELQRIAGYRDSAMEDPELRELMMPALRSDVRMDEEYRLQDKTPLDVPITAVRGSRDEIVSNDDVSQWRDWTTAPFTVVEFPGEHMYFTHFGEAVMRLAAVPPSA